MGAHQPQPQHSRDQPDKHQQTADLAHSAALPSVLPPAEQLQAILPALERAVATLPDKLHDQKDALTGMYLRNLLYSPEGRQYIETQIPGPKRFVLFDCQHAGAANTYGEGKKIDAYFKSLHQIFERTAAEHGIPYVPLRLGGDEFALVLPANRVAAAFLQDVIVAIEESRQSHLGRGSDALGEYVIERNIMRALRNEHRRDCAETGEPFTVSGFYDRLHGICPRSIMPQFSQMLNATGAAERIDEMLSDPCQQDVGRAVLTGFLQKFVATTFFPLVHEPAGRFSGSAVDLGPAPTWADYSLAEACAAKAIGATKDRPFVLEMEEPLPLDRALKIKAHEQEAHLSFQSRMARYAHLREELASTVDATPELRATKLLQTLRLAVTDPNLPGALRAGLLAEVPAEAVLGKVATGPLHALTVDLKSFGIVNNSLSYSEADSMLGALVGVAQQSFPALAVLRHGGGKVTLIGTEPLVAQELEALRDRLSQRCGEFLRSNQAGFERIAMEFGERMALKTRQKESGEYYLPPIDLGTCELTIATLAPKPGEPLAI